MKRLRLGTWDPHVHYLDDLYFARVLRAMHERADDLGADLVVLPSPDDPSDDAAYDDVVMRIRAAEVPVVLDWPHVEDLLEAHAPWLPPFLAPASTSRPRRVASGA